MMGDKLNAEKMLKFFEEKVNPLDKKSLNINKSVYQYKKGLVDTTVVVRTFGSNIYVQIYYHEEGVIEYDRQGVYAKQHKEFLKQIGKKIDQVLSSMKSKQVKYNQIAKSISMYKGKYNQNETVEIQKYEDKDYLLVK